MKLTNMSNTFTVFGSFAVFDEDTIGDINQIYQNCNISINQEPNNPTNRSGRVMRIVDPKTRISISLRPNRIDVQIPGMDRVTQRDKIINCAADTFTQLEPLFSGCLGNRIAYVSNDFIFDDYGDNQKKIVDRIQLVNKNEKAIELSFRINTPSVIENEEVNIVLTINNVMVSNNSYGNAESRPAIMFVYDINTLAKDNTERFDFKFFKSYFNSMFTEINKRLAFFEEF